MGRQIRFFATREDLSELVEYIYINDGVVINENGAKLKKDEIANIQNYEFICSRYRFSDMFVKCNDSKITMNFYENANRHCIDDSASEVIQFSVPQHLRTISESVYDMQVGRFYVETERYNESPIVRKLYDNIVKYIKKNYIISNDKNAYIGKYAFDLYKERKLIPKNYNYAFTF